jgi:hypothetical protein
VETAVYSGSEGAPIETNVGESWGESSESVEPNAVPSAAAPRFAPKTISTEESTAPSVSRSAFPASTVDAKPLGPYAEAGPGALELDFGLADDSAEVGAVEELPTSINRVAEPALLDAPQPIPNGALRGEVAEPLFEDDGLPLQFAPPTRR